jgi:hypothetical protein
MNNIFDEYLKYIESIPEEQLIQELIEAGLNDYLTNENKRDMSIYLAEESYKFGFAVTYDGDNHNVLFGQLCNCCGEYFESEKREIYCSRC